MTRPVRALLKWSNLRHNYRVAKRRAAALAYAVIKANGYGHGLEACANALASEADGFAVACVDEGVRIRSAGFDHPILVLQGAYNAEEWQVAADLGLQLVVHHEQQLQDCQGLEFRYPVPVWLKINSGMNRLGIRVDDANSILIQIEANDNLQLVHVMSHFATADEADDAFFTEQRQIMLKHDWPVPLSLSNSAALMRDESIAEAVSRPGIMLYGSSPLAEKTASELDLRPVMSLQSALISTHEVAAGEGVGYGHSWVAERDTRVGVVAIGYGDGYPRHAPVGTPVNVAGVECPLIGRVSMDMITVDITDVPTAQIGSSVQLWGELVDIDRVAALCGTIGYELYCQVTPRVPRVTLQ